MEETFQAAALVEDGIKAVQLAVGDLASRVTALRSHYQSDPVPGFEGTLSAIKSCVASLQDQIMYRFEAERKVGCTVEGGYAVLLLRQRDVVFKSQLFTSGSSTVLELQSLCRSAFPPGLRDTPIDIKIFIQSAGLLEDETGGNEVECAEFYREMGEVEGVMVLETAEGDERLLNEIQHGLKTPKCLAVFVAAHLSPAEFDKLDVRQAGFDLTKLVGMAEGDVWAHHQAIIRERHMGRVEGLFAINRVSKEEHQDDRGPMEKGVKRGNSLGVASVDYTTSSASTSDVGSGSDMVIDSKVDQAPCSNDRAELLVAPPLRTGSQPPLSPTSPQKEGPRNLVFVPAQSDQPLSPPATPYLASEARYIHPSRLAQVPMSASERRVTAEQIVADALDRLAIRKGKPTSQELAPELTGVKQVPRLTVNKTSLVNYLTEADTSALDCSYLDQPGGVAQASIGLGKSSILSSTTSQGTASVKTPSQSALVVPKQSKTYAPTRKIDGKFGPLMRVLRALDATAGQRGVKHDRSNVAPAIRAANPGDTAYGTLHPRFKSFWTLTQCAVNAGLVKIGQPDDDIMAPWIAIVY